MERQDIDKMYSGKSEAKASTSNDVDVMKNSASPSASLLSIFHEDVLLSILSFVADAPFEVRGGDDAGALRNTRSSYLLSSQSRRAPIDPHSSLTHTLPLVSKQFHKLCSTHDLFWKAAILRLLEKEGDLWEEGIKRVIFEAECEEIKQRIEEATRSGVARRGKRTRRAPVEGETLQAEGGVELTDDATDVHQRTVVRNSSQPHCSASISLSKEESLVDKACQAMQDNPPQNHTATSSGIYQCLYQSVIHRHFRYQAPVFYMPTSIRLGVEYGLHFFEPRYRLLISEVMAPYPVAARRGQRIQPMLPGVYPTVGPIRDDALKSQLLDFLERNELLLKQYHVPTFIHAHQQPLRPNTPATIVRVRHCQIEADGRADVLLEPIAYIWLEQIWERRGTGGLIEARGLRMEKWTSFQYELWSAMAGFGRGDGRGWGQMLPIP